MSSLYADLGGPGSVAAAQMAVADFGGTVLGKKIEVVSADHQNKPDVGASIARQWFDQDGVQMITDLTTSSVALAVQEVAREKNKVLMITSAASSDLTGKHCAPTSIHYVYDTTALANGTGAAVVKAGGKSWFFITADYAFGHALQNDTAVGRRGEWRQGAGLGQRSAQHRRFLVVPASGPGVEGARSSALPMPAATRSTRSSRPPSSASSAGGQSSPGSCCSSATSTALA